jgi:energy-coupling factor transporter transmembrane protein EcfT
VKRFSAWGYVAFTLWGMAMALVLRGWSLAALVAVELAFGLAWRREGLGPLRRVRFWLFIGAAVALGPCLLRPAGSTEASVGLSWMGLSLGLEMAARALTLMLAFSLGLSSLSLSDLVAIFDRLHLRGLGFALGVAMNMVGTLREMARVTFETIKLRGGLRRPVAALRLFLVTVVSNTLRYGDEVVRAASVRAFDPQQGRGSALSPRRADLWLVAVLVVCSVGCWLL